MPIETHTIERSDGSVVSVVVTGTADGDLRIDGPPEPLEVRRRAVVDRPWVWLRQVHGATVVDGDEPGAPGAPADAVVATSSEVALAVHTADCAPVAVVDRAGSALAAAHAGWRGLVAGVVESTVAALRARGAQDPVAVIGPCISPAHYRFDPGDLAPVVARYGDVVRSRTADGEPALDLRAGVRAALEGAGVPVLACSPRCTAASAGELFSHRARGDAGRQALVVWAEPPPGAARPEAASGARR